MRAYRGLVVGTVIIVVGCRQILGIDDPTHQAAPDTPEQGCFGADFADGGLIKICKQPTMGSLVITNDIDTDSEPLCAAFAPPLGPGVCVIQALDITISGPIAVTGKHPLVLVASNGIHLANGATLDVSSKSGGALGAGANDSSCPSQGGGTTGSLGGIGGTFGGVGGRGFGVQAPPPSPVMIQFVRGGCQGLGGPLAGLGPSGPSGGAIYMIAGTGIQLDGDVLANGGGGKGATGSGGGGGGGAGGLIGFDAPMIAGSGSIIAIGGGGGEGGGGSGIPGADGQDPSGKLGQIAKGGSTAPDGGNGGNGGGFGQAATDGGSGSGSGSDIGGGGGGGGGVGIVWVRGTLSDVNVSPQKQP